MVSTIKYPLRRVINWYYGNFCARKCFNDEERLFDCYTKLQQIITENKNLMITHKEFKDMIDNGMITICVLKPNFRRRTVGWGQFEKWLKNSDFDPDKFD